METRRLGDRYEVGALLGRGGMAEVHEGRDLRLGRRVAVKILRPVLAADPSFLARFRREAQSAAALNHPHIVAVYDTGEDQFGEPPNAQTVPYIVMELVEGITLREVLSSGKPLVPERALQITSEILAALDYSHRHGIIHRDIKPGNVMLTQAGSVKVMDFGIARATADPNQTATSTSVLGTAAYLSPEQAQGLPVDARSDLYSTGVVLFELLTHRPPFTGEAPVAVAFAHVNEPPPVPSAVDPNVPASLDPIVAKALAKDLGERYQTALEFRADVERAIAGVPVTKVMPSAAAAAAAAGASDATMVLGTDSDATAALAPAAGPPTVAGGSGAPYQGGPGKPPEEKSGAGRRIGLTLAVLAVLGLVTWAGFSLLTSGARTIAVPNLSGQTVAEAQQILTDAKLTLGREDARTSEETVGTIIDQDPSRGEMVAEGARVNVTVSAGREQVAVPDLTNYRSLDDVRSQLAAVGLSLGQVTPENSDEPADTVLRQDPAPLTMVDAGSAVRIWVSNGLVQVPNVVGKTDEAAREILLASGFEIVYADPVESDNMAAGRVLRQSPSSGTAQKGSTVTLTLSKAPAPTPTPTPTPSPTTAEPEPSPASPDGGGADGDGGAAGNLDSTNPGLSLAPQP